MKTYNLICIHGNSLSPDVFKKIEVPGTVKHSLTLPGHDHLPLGKIDSFQKIIQHTISEIENTQNIILLGLSLGGHIAHNISSQLDSVKAMVSIAAPPLAAEFMADAFLGHPLFGELFNPKIESQQLKSLVQALVANSENYEEIQSMIERTDPNLRKMLGESLASGGFLNEIDLLKKFQGIKIFLHPDSDPFINGDYVLNLNLGAFHRIKGGHVLTLDNPLEINKLLSSLVNELNLNHG